ncbi:MAG: TnpV protein [Lachnospiraceae bacterium]|nr:TnpV protein [Lachnospiraceae bacterium]
MKSLYEQMGGTYHWEGDYLIPDLVVTEEDRPIGLWGRRHLQYLKQESKLLYTELLTSGRLNSYLAEVNAQAEERMLLLTEQMAQCEGITEQLKAQDQMAWVQGMNNIKAQAMEIVNHELIYI